MIKPIITAILLTAFIQGCGAETKNSLAEKSSIGAIPSNTANENVIQNFSTALTNKDLNLLLTIADPKDIYLVRTFTSGNLGGRGPSFRGSISTSRFNKDLALEIQKQTPFELPELFTDLPIKSTKTLPHHLLLPEAETASFDQWEPLLKKSLKGLKEADNGDPVLLVSGSSKYWVYTEAQIIDDILVGGFAVFSVRDGKLRLVCLIELL